MDKSESGNCYFCHVKCDKDQYCHGCKHFVCDSDECNRNLNMPWGGHDVSVHMDDDEDDY